MKPPKQMATYNILNQHFPGRVIIPQVLANIPAQGYMVYVLSCDDRAIVVGHGKKNRARIILDSATLITLNHVKAIFVRLHHLFPKKGSKFDRYLITCASKEEAKAVERQLHTLIGGNSRGLPARIRRQLFAGITRHSMPWLFLKLALLSSFDGLADLRGWHRARIIDAKTWRVISKKLQL